MDEIRISGEALSNLIHYLESIEVCDELVLQSEGGSTRAIVHAGGYATDEMTVEES